MSGWIAGIVAAWLGLGAQPLSFPFGGEGWGYPITRAFGERTPDGYHTGVDVGAPCGVPVLAVGEGIILEASMGRGGESSERFLIIQHGRLVAFYGHLATLRRRGGRVRRGEPIATVGRTGRALGCHLHLALARADQGAVSALIRRGYVQRPPTRLGFVAPGPALGPGSITDSHR